MATRIINKYFRGFNDNVFKKLLKFHEVADMVTLLR